MTTKRILIVSGINHEKLGSWNQLKNAETKVVHTDENAIEMSQRQGFDVIIIDYSDININHKKLSAILPILLPEVQLFSYNGEAHESLEARVNAYFIQKRNERIKRWLVLNDSTPRNEQILPAFSAN
jgi:hypothetical protein